MNYVEIVRQKVIDRLYETWFQETLHHFYERTGSEKYSSSSALLAACGYVQTITFDQRRIAFRKDARGLGRQDTSIEFDTFHGGYMEITKHLVNDKRYDQARFAPLWPMAFVGIDYEGSRYAEPGSIGSHNAHVHAIWCVHPDVQARFEAFIAARDLEAKFRTYGPCDAVEFKRYVKPASGSHTYGIKAHTKTFWNPSSAPDIRIYPNPDWSVKRIYWKTGRNTPNLGGLRKFQIVLRMQDAEDKVADGKPKKKL